MRLPFHVEDGGRGPHQSRPISPANRPVNVLTHNAAGSPCSINDTRNSAGKSMSDFNARMRFAAMGGGV